MVIKPRDYKLLEYSIFYDHSALQIATVADHFGCSNGQWWTNMGNGRPVMVIYVEVI